MRPSEPKRSPPFRDRPIKSGHPQAGLVQGWNSSFPDKVGPYCSVRPTAQVRSETDGWAAICCVPATPGIVQELCITRDFDYATASQLLHERAAGAASDSIFKRSEGDFRAAGEPGRLSSLPAKREPGPRALTQSLR